MKKERQKHQKAEFRYYEIPENEYILALIGDKWIQNYGVGIDYLHFHNYLEIGICHSGNGTITIDKKNYEFTEGAIAIIPPNILHHTECPIGVLAHWDWLYLDLEAVVQQMYFGNALKERDVLSKVYEQCHFFPNRKQEPVLDNILSNIVREAKTKKELHQESIRAWIQVFVIEVLRNAEEPTINKQRTQHDTLMNIAIDYIEKHYQEPIKVSELAAFCNISESYFRRRFVEITQMKPMDFINMVRIQKACSLIRRSDDSFKEISYKVGFGTVSTFNRNWQKFVGIPPNQWRKQPDMTGEMRGLKINAKRGW